MFGRQSFLQSDYKKRTARASPERLALSRGLYCAVRRRGLPLADVDVELDQPLADLLGCHVFWGVFFRPETVDDLLPVVPVLASRYRGASDRHGEHDGQHHQGEKSIEESHCLSADWSLLSG